MLQNIRDNSQGWIAKTIIGIIVVLLAFTGVEAIFGPSGSGRDVAEVNGEPITQRDLEQAVSMQRNQLLQQLGGDFDPGMLNENLLRESALTGLIDRTLLLQATRDARFAYSQGALDQIILQTPEFQVNGRFDANRFDQVIQRLGYSRMQFRELLEQEMLIGQLRAGIAGSGFVTDQQIEAFVRLEAQTRDFEMLMVQADPATVEVNEEEIQQYYEANQERFRSPEQVLVEYVALRKNDFFDQVEVDEAQVEALYRRQIANLAEQRRAAHILVETDGDVSDADARAQVEAIRQRLEQGEDFAELARELSQDAGSADEGGDLGYAGPGVYDQEFEDALYALSEEEVSEPVRTEFGWHLIQLLGVQAPEIPALETVRLELERQIRAEQVEQRFVEASKRLEGAAYESADLEQPAEEMGLEVLTAGPFSREGGEGLAANRQFVQAAFSELVLIEGANSELIELDTETAVILRVREHQRPQVLPLEEVAERIEAQLRRSKATEQARSEGEAVLAQLREGAALDRPWQRLEAASRNQDGIDPAVLQQVFRMPRPAQAGSPSHGGLVLGDGSYAVVRLLGVNDQPSVLDDEQRPDYRRFLASRAGQQDFAAFMNELRSNAKIERN
ncbi:SurA N-terminal domain-containing protein [Stutzerimonas tarimensis]|uniref:Periplasmic chaperone PpiD n=1 Tax=Stutzerimonas tarimensis TaxID=1507735 RepID=A0ABV7T331_9GAMM